MMDTSHFCNLGCLCSPGQATATQTLECGKRSKATVMRTTCMGVGCVCVCVCVRGVAYCYHFASPRQRPALLSNPLIYIPVRHFTHSPLSLIHPLSLSLSLSLSPLSHSLYHSLYNSSSQRCTSYISRIPSPSPRSVRRWRPSPLLSVSALPRPTTAASDHLDRCRDAFSRGTHRARVSRPA